MGNAIWKLQLLIQRASLWVQGTFIERCVYLWPIIACPYATLIILCAFWKERMPVEYKNMKYSWNFKIILDENEKLP